MSRSRVPTERVRSDRDSTHPGKTVTAERLGFAGGRVVESRRSEPSLRKASERAGSQIPETKRHEPRRSDKNEHSGRPEREILNSKPRRFASEKDDIALERERLGVEKEILALEVVNTDLERERVALERKKLKLDQEAARVTHLIELLKLKRRVWGRSDLQVINEELEKIHGRQ